MPSLLATSGTEAPVASSASAWRSLRTICSGVCLFFTESPPCAHLRQSDSHSNWISFRGAAQLGKTNVYTLAKVRTQKDEDIVRQKCQNGTSGNAKLTLQKMPHWHTKEYTEEKRKAHEINVNGNFPIQKPKLGDGLASLRDILTQYGIDGASRGEITPKPKLKSEHYAKRDYVATELAHDFADSKSLGCYRTIAEKVPEHVIFEVRSAVLDAYRNGTIRENRGALFVGIIQEYCVRHGIALGFQNGSTGAYSPEA